MQYFHYLLTLVYALIYGAEQRMRSLRVQTKAQLQVLNHVLEDCKVRYTLLQSSYFETVLSESIQFFV